MNTLYIITKQEVLGRTNLLLSFDTTRTAKKATPQTILHCSRNVLIKPLPSNGRRDKHTDPQSDERDL
jgi:hypothetical protein